MDRTLVDFVKALRTAEVKVSPAETLDAMHAMNIVGYEDREFLKNSLGLVLAKNPEEKETFDSCFDRFFTFDKFQSSMSDEMEDDTSSAFDDDGDFDLSERGENQQSGKGGGQGGAGGGGQAEADLEESTLQPTSALGKLLMSGDRTELTIAMAEAGREVEVNQIVVFTQKGLYTRKIMDAMGLKGLQDEIGELKAHGGVPQSKLSGKLKKARDQLREKVRDYVEKQFFLHADESGKQLREELLKKVKLSNLEKRNFKDVQEVVFKMAKKLIAIHSKRRKTYRRGQLDVRKTLRSNMQ
ncbi:MAG: hypothetical protein WD558_03005, partial [Pseudomonadales bacterium]